MPDSGNDNVQIQGLEFVIKTVTEQAKGIEEIKKGLDDLGGSLKKMPNAVKKLSGLANSLSKLSAVKLQHLDNVVSGLNELSKIGRIKTRIPEQFIDELSVLNIVSQSLKSSAIEATGKALQAFNGIQLPKIPASFTTRLTDLSNVSQTVQPEAITRLGEALHTFNSLEFKDGFSRSLSAIANVSSVSSQIDAGKVYSLIPALKAFQGLNFNFSPSGLASALTDIVSTSNAITNDTVNSLYRLSVAVKSFETFNMTNSGNFRELGDALSSFSYFSIPKEFTESMEYIKNGIKTFESISNDDIKRVAQLTMLFNNMPTDEMTNFYEVLDSFGSATRDLTELGRVNLAPLKDFLITISGMHMVGDTVISPAFVESVHDLVTSSEGIQTGDLAKLMEAIINVSKIAKKGDFKFPTGFADFVTDMQRAISLFANVDDSVLEDRWLFLQSLTELGEVPHIHSIAEMFKAFNGIGEVSISEDLTTRLKEITEFVNSLSNEQIDKVKDYAEALKYLADAQKTVRGKLGELPKNVERPETEEAPKNKFQEIYEKMSQQAQTVASAIGYIVKKMSILQGIIEKVRGVVSRLKAEWQAMCQALPEGTSLATKIVVFSVGKIVQGIDALIKGVINLNLTIIQNIFSIKNIQTVLKALGTVAIAPVKAIQALDKAIAGIPKRIQKFVSHVKKAIKAVERFVKGIQKAVKNVKKFVDSVGNKLLSPVQKAVKGITQFFKSLQRIAFYRLIRRGIQIITQGFQEGMENLYQYSLLIDGQFHKSMDLIATDALYVKNSLAAMISPIINQIAPAIDLLTDKFVDLLNLINQTFSALTGKSTYTAAKKFKTEWAEAENSVKDAGDAVKDTLEEIKRYTLGFDELNILGEPKNDKNKNSNDNGDSDEDLTDYLGMFEERSVTSMISDFVKDIRDKIADGKFYEIGKMIAEKMNEVIRSIPFQEWGEWIGEKVNNAVDVAKGFLDFADFVTLGSGVGKFLNKAFEQIEFHNLGAVLAGKLRLALQFAFGFVSEFHFKAFGKNLGQMVSGFFMNIDFDKAVLTLQWGLEGILDTIDGFLQTLQSFALGVKIRNALSLVEFEGITSRLQFIGEELQRSFSDFLKGLGIEFDSNTNVFDRLGADLGTKLTEIFNNIPYAKLGELLGKGIQKIVANARNFWQNLDLSGHLGNESLGNGIAQFINNAVANVDFYSVGMTIAEKLSTVFNGIASFLNRVNWNSVFEAVSSAVTGFFENLSLDKIDFKRIVNPLADTFDTVATKIADFLVDAFQSNDFPEVGSAIGRMLNSALGNLGRVLSALNPKESAGGISSFIESVLNEVDPNNFNTVIDQIIGGTLDLAVELLKKVDFKAIGTVIGQAIKEVGLERIVADILTAIGEEVGGAFEFFTGLLFGKYKEKGSDSNDKKSVFGGFFDVSGLLLKATAGILEHTKGFRKDFSEEWDGTWSDASDELSEWGEWLKTGWKDITSGVKLGDIFSAFSIASKDCKDGFSADLDETKNELDTFWEWWRIGWGKSGSTATDSENVMKGAFDGISASSSDLITDFDADSLSWASICQKFQDNFNTGMDEIVKKHQESKEESQKQWGLWQDSFNETIDNVLHYVEKLKTGIKVAGNFIKSVVKNALNGCIGVVEGFVNGCVFGFNTVADVINGFSIDIPSWVPVLGGNSWSPNLPKFSTVSLARYDKGGFPKSGDLFFANENGSPELVGKMGNQTAVVNNEQIVQGIAQAVAMVVNSGSLNQLIRQEIQLLQAIAEKDTTVEVTTGQIDKAKNRKNLRNGVLS